MLLHVLATGLLITASASHTDPPAPLQGKLLNPDRGFLGLCPLTSDIDLSHFRESYWITLCYAPIFLSHCRAEPIPNTTLSTIHNQFSKYAASGLKAVVRIVYDDSAVGNDTTLDWVEHHLIQLRPLFEQHGHVIAWFEAGVIGAWGEWHDSVNHLDSPENRQAVWNLLVAHLPPLASCAQILVRRPDYAVQLEPSINSTTEFSITSRDDNCTGAQRISHHNDCWLASASDAGTYEQPGMSDEQARSFWLQFLDRFTQTRIWGGETCATSSYSHCNHSALSDAETLHATFLNNAYNPSVIADLKAEGCWDHFERQLGYRIAVTAMDVPNTVLPLTPFSLSVTLTNQGWAAPMLARPVYLRLVAATPSISSSPAITIDGSFSDWENLPESKVVTSTTQDLAGVPHHVSVTSDKDCVYIRTTAATAHLDASRTGFLSSQYSHVFLDTDNNSRTGKAGYDVVVRAGKPHVMKNGDWVTVDGKPVTCAKSKTNGTIENECCLPRSWVDADGSAIIPESNHVIGLKLTTDSRTHNISNRLIPEVGDIRFTLASRSSPATILFEELVQNHGDVRQWCAGCNVTITHTSTVPSIVSGYNYIRAALWLPDSSPDLAPLSAFAMQFANQDTWDNDLGHNVFSPIIAVIG